MPPIPSVRKSNRFDSFFEDPAYLTYKNHYYNFRIRRRRIVQVLKRERPATVLEIGAGISPISPPGENIIYSDCSVKAMRGLRKDAGSAGLLAMSATDLALRDGAIRAIVCSEVLEHIEDDGRALAEMARVLASNGLAILTVPVNPYLYSLDDRMVKHCRRYNIWELCAQLGKLGFSGLKVSPVTGLLDKAVWIMTVLMFKLFFFLPHKKRTGRRRERWHKILFPVYLAFNWILMLLVMLEAKLVPMALATDVLIVCRKGPARG